MASIQASQFIGSKISLVTKAEIRYEGILYALDLQEATISLAKVKSFGTEDRSTDKPVPPKDDVFEFIIFRGADIKSLDVVEPPKSVTALTSGVPPNDPAIVEVSYHHTASSSSGSGGNKAAKLTHSNNNAGVLSSLLSGQSPTKGNGGNNSRRRRKSSNGGNGNGAQGGQQQQRRGRGNRNRNNGNGNSNNSGNQSDTSQNAASNQNGNTSGQRQTGRGRSRGRPSRQNSTDASTSLAEMRYAAAQAYFQQPPFMMHSPGFRGAFRGGRGRGFGRRYQQPQGIIEAQQPAKVTFEEPFDFEKSHEELVQTLAKLEVVDKEKAAAAVEAAQNGEAAPGNVGESYGEKEIKEEVIFYCKENFFDNISCEGLKKRDQRPGRNFRVDRRAEQKLNTETFGISGARGGPRRGGGSYYYRNSFYANRNPYLAMMAAGGYDPTGYFMPGNGGFGNYRRGGGGRGGGGGGGGGGGRNFYRGGFYDNF